MSLGTFVGRQIGAYRIDAFIGAGGMGEVYKAHDTRLHRDVAVKVLAAQVSGDPGRLKRFEQEARAVAAVNHPNILALYDVGAADDISFLVTELLEGRTLRQVLRDETLSTSRAVDLMAQVADGLAAAHGRGIVHRDVKPENVFVTNEGRAKLLDFGLAKAAEPREDAPTRSGTAPNVVMGTPAYMAPEQVRGQPLDSRADIFAFGAVLHEILTGRPAFSAGTASDVMSAILRDSPAPLTSSPHWPLPPALVRIVERCLEKSPAARFQSTADLAFALRALSPTDSNGAADLPRLTASGASSWRRTIVWSLGAAILGALVTTAVWRPWRSEAVGIVDRMSWQPAGLELLKNTANLALSPDGRRLVFSAREAGVLRLYLRRLDQFEATAIPNTDHGFSAFFSPDGRWLGFKAGNRLKKVGFDGNEPSTICVCDASGATWGSDDLIVFASGDTLQQVPTSGGEPKILAQLPSPETATSPQTLGDGRVLFTRGSRQANLPDRAAVLLPDGSIRTLLEDATMARYMAPGHLVFWRSGAIQVVGFDSHRLELTGAPLPILEGTSGVSGPDFAVSASGTIAYVPGPPPVLGTFSLAWFDRIGHETPLPFPPAAYSATGASVRQVRLAPDNKSFGAMIDTDVTKNLADLWLCELDRSTCRPFARPNITSFAWMRDGRRVVYRKADGAVFSRKTDFSEAEIQVARADSIGIHQGIEDVSPDGAMVLIGGSEPKGPDGKIKYGIWIMTGLGPETAATSPTVQVRAVVEAPFGLSNPRWSKDGRLLAYFAFEPGAPSTYVRPFPDPGPTVQIRASPGRAGFVPGLWWRDQEILYFDYQAKNMMAVEVFSTPTLHAGPSRVAFSGLSAPIFFGDISSDGHRLLAMRPVPKPPDPPQRINFIVNWVDEVRRRLAGGK